MDRLEAQRRLFNAIQILMRHGWTEAQVDALITGLHREDAVEAAERNAAAEAEKDVLTAEQEEALSRHDQREYEEKISG